MENTGRFCKIIRQRSQENKQAIGLLSRIGLTGQVMSVLRQELDSMVRVIFLSCPYEYININYLQKSAGWSVGFISNPTSLYS
jgi:hypothetical protein